MCDCRRAATDNAERRYVGKVLNAEKRVWHDKNLGERNIVYHSTQTHTHARARVEEMILFLCFPHTRAGALASCRRLRDYTYIVWI